MSEATQLSANDAILQVLADGGAMDYVDVVDAVQKRYRQKVSSALVEQVHKEFLKKAKKKKKNKKSLPGSRMNIVLTSNLSDELESPQPAKQTSIGQVDPKSDNLVHALQFVRTVGGLRNAKQALAELESVLHGDD